VLVIDPVHLTGTVRAYIGLGANIGEPLAQIRKALTAIGLLPSTRLVAASSVYRSAAVGYVDQPDYFNSVAAVDTTLTGHALLLALLDIERDGGRTREFRNAPRTIDLDLLLYGDRTIAEPGLSVPHPRMAERAFVLLPLAEIDPGCFVPGKGPLPLLVEAVRAQAIERVAGPSGAV
jgi:2-amino-4-hydroxy-6-hydroxymethyldihydropteridine diphosphokinase